jgi:ABC-type phosphate transport system substrate-binding protein
VLLLVEDIIIIIMIIARAAALVLAAVAPLGVSAIPCGPNTAFTMTGSSAVVPVAQSWATAYSNACGNKITVSSAGSTSGGGSIVGAQEVCGVGGTVDIGLLSRQLISPTEAVENTKNPYLYTCAKGLTSRVLTEVQVAIDGLAFLSGPTGIAAKCIPTLAGGGFTFSQIRWIYSSFTLAKLKSDPLFDPLAVPNPSGSGDTRLWSELCSGSGCNCPATPIGIAGSPTTSGTYTFFAEKIFRGSGETVRSGYLSDASDSQTYVTNLVTESGNGAILGFTLFAPYNNDQNNLYAAAVQDPDDGVYRLPTFAQFSTGEYPASFFLYMEVSAGILSTVQDFFVYAFSDAGNNDVLNTGILPIPNIAATQMLSRLGAAGGVSLSGIACGPGGSIFMGGSSTVYPVAYLWGNVYGDACGLTITVLSGGSTFGAQLACGIPDPVSGTVADIGTLSREFLSTEAYLPAGGNGYDYKCLIGTKRTVRQFPVAIDGITFAYPLNGAAAKCLPTITGKGLSVDQLRWMYSSYGYSQLVANGWNPKSVPGYTASTTANHFWSYLGGSGCPAEEIAIAGSPSTSGTNSFFQGVTFTGSGETIALNRPDGYYNVPEDNPNEVVQYLQATPASIGYFGYSYYAKNTATLGAVAIENSAGVYVPPSFSVFADGTYNPYTRFVYMQLVTVFLTFQKTVAFVKFGTQTTVGDTLAEAAGLFPLGSATKALIAKRFTLTVPCFSETATVQVLNKGVVSVKDLMIGDQVMNAEGKYDTVYSFGHYSHETEAEFVQLHITGVSKPLEVSKEHMIFTGSGVAVPASAIALGDKIQLVSGASAEVKKIAAVVRHGAYAPFTMSGTIAVNDVAASSYVDMQNKAGVLMIGSYSTGLSMQFLAHMFQAPHRLACIMASPAYCQTETYDESGVSSWVAGPLVFTEWALKQHAVIMSVVFVVCFLVGLFIYAVELMMVSKMMMMLLALMAGASAVAVCNKKKTMKQV